MHHFTFYMLSKISNGYRPSQIAEQLDVTPQDIHYHIGRMIQADLIYKDKSNGIRWKLTEKGFFILKQKATGSVNSFNNYQTKPVSRIIPTRLDNIAFKFKILSPISADPHLHWTEMKNGVHKCVIRYDAYTIELVKSEKQRTKSALLVHLDGKYCFDWCKELINQYNLAIHYARLAAVQFRLEISETGYSVKRPHIAFEEDLSALFIAASNTAEIKTKEVDEGPECRAWIDRSNGAGELETNDPDYAYLYLMMPKTVDEIADALRRINKYIGDELFYHPLKTVNN